MNHLESPGQWIAANLESGEAQIFTFTVSKPGWHTVYLASSTEQDRGTVDVEVDGVKRTAGGYNGRTAFNLAAGNHSAVITAREDTKRKVAYYQGAIGVSIKNLK